ncbi:basic proline-rich protein-like [Hippopotamus amphibius kiboko]|uniref:basic proline-rich protein-like n=1 Tax=Hippopotamus amphibius kiboko TaxID=575201 RepID=UPI00259707AC|nr:basic proline-rich protein-like [Hippopotamus amphibius kiboko]
MGIAEQQLWQKSGQSVSVRAPSHGAGQRPQVQCRGVAERSDWFTVSFSLVGDREALAVKPGVFGSRAGFREPGRAAAAPRPPTRTPRLPTPCARARQLPAVPPGPERRLRSPPAPHPAGAGPARASPHLLSPGGAGRRVLSSDLRGCWLGPAGSRAAAAPPAAGTARHGCKMDSRRRRTPPRRPPPPAPRAASRPSLAFVPPPGSLLSRGREWVRGGEGSERRREHFRYRQPPPPAVRPGDGRLWGCAPLCLPEGLRAPAERRARGAGKEAWVARTRGLGLADRGRREAASSPVEPPGKNAGARQDGWVWIVVLFFLFVAFLGTKKKAQPFTPLHPHLSGQEARPQRLVGTETTVRPAPHSPGWVGRAPASLQPEHNQNSSLLPPSPQLASICFFAGIRLNTRYPIQGFFLGKYHCPFL